MFFSEGKKLMTTIFLIPVKHNSISKSSTLLPLNVLGVRDKSYLLTGTDFDVQLLVIKGMSLGT